MDANRITRWGAISVLVAPIVLLVGFAYHPYLPSIMDKAAVAAALEADHVRWHASHLLVAIGAALLLVAFLALRRFLVGAGEDRWSARAVPFVAGGSVLFAMLPALELGLMAGVEAGANAEQGLRVMDASFVPILLTSSVLFLLGCVGFAIGVLRSGVLGGATARLVAAALFVMAAVRFVPLGLQFYVGGVAGVVAFLPLAHAMWVHASDTAPGMRPIRHAQRGLDADGP